MTNKKAKELWEGILIHGAQVSILKKLKLTKEEAKVFISYTMPEMFVNKELNRVNLSRVKELKKEEEKILSIIETKKSSNLITNIGLFFYFIIVAPILLVIIYIKYLF